MSGNTGTMAALAGTAVLLIGLSIVTGIVVNVVNNGETHKEEMMMSPPPPPAVSRRELFDPNLFEPPQGNAFKLKPGEASVLDSLSHQPLKR